MSGFLSPDPRLRELSDLGLVQAGALLHTYVSGTPSTPLATYTTDTLGVANANPVVASAGGLFPPIYLTPGSAYKYVLTDALGNPLWTQDPILVPASSVAVPAGVSGAIPYFSAIGVLTSSALLAQHAVVVGGGVGAAPLTIAVLATGQVLGGVTGGDPVPLALGVQDRQVTLQTVSNTAVETTVYTFAVPAGLLGTNRTLKLSLIGDQLQNSGASDKVYTIKVKYGATTIFNAALLNVVTGAGRTPLIVDVELTGANATNAQRAKGFAWTSSLGAISGQANSQNDGTSNTTVQYAVHTTIAEDSTAIKNLVVTFTMSVAAVTMEMRAHTVYTELK